MMGPHFPSASVPNGQFGFQTLQKERAIDDFEERCRFAETRALQAEMRLSKVMIQIYRDSPRLATCLLLSNKQAPTNDKNEASMEPKFLQMSQKSELGQLVELPETVSKLSFNKLSQSSVEKISELSVPQDQLDEKALYAGDEHNKSDSKTEESAPKLGGAQSMLEKLTIELWKTKKQLFIVLQEKESTKNNVSLLDVKEYEDIINQLQHDLLLLRCQYTEIRQALQSQHPDDILHIIGRLQDKARKQQKIITQQQSLILSQQSSKGSLGMNDSSNRSQGIVECQNSQTCIKGHGSFGFDKTVEDFSGGDNSLGFRGTVEGGISQGSSGTVSSEISTIDDGQSSYPTSSMHDKLKPVADVSQNQHEKTLAQLHRANNQVKYLKEELTKTRNTMESLRSKCQMLGEQYEHTLYTLRKMEELRGSKTLANQQKAVRELSWLREQLNRTAKATETLKEENENLKNLLESRGQQYEKNLEFMKESLITTNSDLQKYKIIVKAYLNENKYRHLNVTACAQALHQPVMLTHRLSEVGLLVDGGKSLDPTDFSMPGGQLEEGAREQGQKLNQSCLGENSPIQEEDKDASSKTEQKAAELLGTGQQEEAQSNRSEKMFSNDQQNREQRTKAPQNQEHQVEQEFNTKRPFKH